MKEIVDNLVEWLRDSVKEANCKGIVYGLSGGVDSAVIAALSKLAFGDESLAIMMPINSSFEDEIDAKLVIDKFNLNAIKVDLSRTYSEFVEVVEKGDNNMAYANVKPRLRMTTLYYYAQLKGYLVVGTSNKSEFTVGYFTKYGDGGADIMPLYRLNKRQGKALLKKLGCPEHLYLKKPTADLEEERPALEDEVALGVSYDNLDDYLEGKKVPEEIAKIIEGHYLKSEHKRNMPVTVFDFYNI